METHARTLGKTISWRIIATIITATIAWLLTNDVSKGMVIGLIDTSIKFVAYYFHERTWVRVTAGYKS